MSKGRPWYKRYPADFLSGTTQLTLEEKGAYSVALDLMYERGGPIPDDQRWIANVCGCGMRRWRQIRARLLTLGKLNLTDDGRLANGRATYEMHRSNLERGEKSDLGKRGRALQTAEKVEKNSRKTQEKVAFFRDELNENNSVANFWRGHTQSLDSTRAKALVCSDVVAAPASSRPARKKDPWRERCAARISAAGKLTPRGCHALLTELLRMTDGDHAPVENAIARLEAVRPSSGEWGFMIGTVRASQQRAASVEEVRLW